MTNTVLNTKIGEIEKKTRDVSGLVKRTNYNTKIFSQENRL